MQRHPNFIIGGTAAGGTSFLSAILVQHPEIYLPKKMRPEPHFFYKSWEYEKGIENYLEQWFSQVTPEEIAVGERSSSYLFGAEFVAPRIANYYRNMKFIFTLRSPIQRAWANYRYTVLQGLEPLSFEDALKNEKNRIQSQKGIWAEIQPHNYTGRGLYAEQLRYFFKEFSEENILAIKSETLSQMTNSVLRVIYLFLELENLDFEYTRPPDHTSVNVHDPALQVELREYFKEDFDIIIEAIRKKQSIDIFVKNNLDSEKILLLKNNLYLEKLDISDWAKDYLTNFYKKDLKQLSSIVQFDLSDWT